jgi:hypothetical protein
LQKPELYPDLKWIDNKFSYSALFKELYRVGQVRYATREQLYPFNKQVWTKPNLVKFCELDYLKPHDLVKAFHITEKTREILEKEGFNVKVLQKKFTGQTLDHALKITSCLLKLQGQDNFYNVFYPTFTEPPSYTAEFLKPDACVVWKRDGAYKIEFIEVEKEKPDWENYLFIKKEKYEKLARDPNTYRFWWKGKEKKTNHEKLNLPLCQEANFCFSIVCFGNIKKEWGGWKFE